MSCNRTFAGGVSNMPGDGIAPLLLTTSIHSLKNMGRLFSENSGGRLQESLLWASKSESGLGLAVASAVAKDAAVYLVQSSMPHVLMTSGIKRRKKPFVHT